MKIEHAITARLREQARYLGKTIFQHELPCPECGTYDCYTSQKGRACVECRRCRKQAAATDPVKLAVKRAINRESYNRNRPSHNPEQVLFNGVKRAGFIQAGVTTDQEWQALQVKADLLKLANGTEGGYTLDHIEPVAGFEVNGIKYYGKTTAENLRLETIERNKAKAGQRVSDSINPAMVTVKPSDAIEVDKSTSTEEMRSLFYRMFGINTRPNSTYNAGEKLEPEEEKKFFKEALTEAEAMRAATVLEIMMAGRPDLLQPSEKNPLPWYWDEDKRQKVQKQIVVVKGLHSDKTLSIASQALEWFDKALHQIHMAKAAQADWSKDFATVSPFPESFTEPGARERVERHFIEWATSWFTRLDNEKPIYDFLGLVEEPTYQQWFKSRMKEADLRSVVSANENYLLRVIQLYKEVSAFGERVINQAISNYNKSVIDYNTAGFFRG